MHGFDGAGEDMDLLTLLFESSSSIRKVTLRAGSSHSLRWMVEEDNEGGRGYGEKTNEHPFY